MRLLIVALIFVCAVGTLVGVSLSRKTIPVVEFSYLTSPDSGYGGGTVILDGTRIVEIESLYPSLSFRVAPEGETGEPVRVVSSVSPPQNFSLDKDVRLFGTFDAEARTFNAYQVTTQCPSKYDPTTEAKKARERNRAAEAVLEGPLETQRSAP